MSKNIRKPNKEVIKTVAELLAVGVNAVLDLYLKKNKIK